MSIIFRIIRFDSTSPPVDAEFKWDVMGGTMGRSSSNDWVLPDDSLYLSSQHATLCFQNGDYYITDTSTNGVFINQNSMPLGRDNIARLESGDTLKMGGYVMEVVLDEGSSLPGNNGDRPECPIPENPIGVESEASFPILSGRSLLIPDDPIVPNPENPIDIVLEALPSIPSERGLLIPVVPDDPVVPDGGGESGNERGPITREDPIPGSLAHSICPPPVEDYPEISGQGKRQDMDRLLASMGIADESARHEIVKHVSPEKIGQLFRTMLQGSMDILKTRAEIKNEMRMDVTTFQAVQNNPVKFSANVDDALLKLLMPPAGSPFMGPELALAEVFDDIKVHQVAVIAGVQESLKLVMKRFDPNRLVERLQKQSRISAKIPIQRQAKLWDLFEGLYSTIEEEASDDFQRLFGLEFALAYEKQIEQLKRMNGS